MIRCLFYWLSSKREAVIYMEASAKLCGFIIWHGNLLATAEWCDNEAREDSEYCTVHENALDPGYDPNEYLSNGAEE